MTVQETNSPDTEPALPHLFVTEPAGKARFQSLALCLSLGALVPIVALVRVYYLPQETALLLMTAYFTLAAAALLVLHRAGSRSELWLDVSRSRYRARWNRFGVGRTGQAGEIAGATVKQGDDSTVSELWVEFKSMDLDPLLIETCSDAAEAEALRERFTSFLENAAATASGSERHSDTMLRGQSPSAGRPRQESPGTQFWGGVIILTLIIPVVGWGLHSVKLATSLDDHATAITGRVTGRSTQYSKGHEYYHVSYKFSAGGETYTGESSVLHSAYGRAIYLSPAAVEYLPEDPRVNRLAGAISGQGSVLVLAGLAFGAVGLFGVLTGYRRMNEPGIVD